MFRACRQLVLASGSPRRKELMASSGLDALVSIPENADDTNPFSEPRPQPQEAPEAYVMRSAQAKALAVAPKYPQAVILAADTIVCLPQQNQNNPLILGKPTSMTDAFQMLKQLSGKTHHVLTGCCILWQNTQKTQAELFVEQTAVTFAAWSDTILQNYAASEEPKDKAGSYAIQGHGAFLVAHIEGSWSNVVGLPLSLVLQRLCTGGAIEPFQLSVDD